MAVRPCLRLFVPPPSHRAGVCTRAHVHVRACVRECGGARTACACEHVSVRTCGTKSCANTSLPAGNIIALDPEQVTPSGTSLVQSFLLVTLPVTSTSMRYDRYDTCLYVRAPRPSRHTRKCLARIGRADGRRTRRDFGAKRRRPPPRENYFSRGRVAPNYRGVRSSPVRVLARTNVTDS